MMLGIPRSHKGTEVKVWAGSLTPLRDQQNRLGKVVINVWRVLHAADKSAVVAELWTLDSDGSITVSNIPSPGDPVFEPPRCCGVWDGLVMKNLRGGTGNHCGTKTLT